jgi:NAD+ kinase
MGLLKAVGLVLHPQRDTSQAVATMTDWARGHGMRVYGLRGEQLFSDHVETVEPDVLAERSSVLVSLGGDGTMLRALRLSFRVDVPVLGVNLGKLGFLAEVDVPDLPPALEAIDAGQYSVEPRVAMEACVGARRRVAFNDIALIRSPGHGQAAVALRVDGHSFVRYVGDAIVVATPAGSTAYSFSAGGPIVSPRTEGLLVTPVAPHSAFNRAVVLSSDEKLSLELLPGSGELAIEVDGMLTDTLRAGQRLDVVTHPGAGRVVRLGHTTFYQRARRKLGLTDSAELL